MKPYYEADGITIYHGDCRELDVASLGDVLVTDPPYGMAYRQGRRNGPDGWSSRWTDVEIAGDGDSAARDEILEAWGTTSPALVFSSWKVPVPVGTREVLAWDKVISTGMGALDIPWRPSWEMVCVIGHGFTGSREHGVLRFGLPTLAPERKMHPTPKPLELMRYLVARCPAGTIVDPFMGSGSTLRAAKDLGRQAVGVELEERYCEIAVQRLAQMNLDLGDAA